MRNPIPVLAESLSPSDPFGLYVIGVAGKRSPYVARGRASVMNGALKLVERDLPLHEAQAARAIVGFYLGAIPKKYVPGLAGLDQTHEILPSMTRSLEERVAKWGIPRGFAGMERYHEATDRFDSLLRRMLVLNREGFSCEVDIERNTEVYTDPDIPGVRGEGSPEAVKAQKEGFTHMAWRYDVSINPDNPSSPVPCLASMDSRVVLGTMATGIRYKNFVPGYTFPTDRAVA